MNVPPISSHWVIEYSFSQDSFGVRSVPEYMTRVQRAFLDGRFFDWGILAIHPSEEACREECSMWQERRDKSPLHPEAVTGELLRIVLMQQGQLAFEIAVGDASTRPLGR